MLIALLVSIAMDAITPAEVMRTVIATIESLCVGFCPAQTTERSQHEKIICKKLLSLSESYSTQNKAQMLSLLIGGTPAVRRIGQWLAFDMLFPESGLATVRLLCCAWFDILLICYLRRTLVSFRVSRLSSVY